MSRKYGKYCHISSQYNGLVLELQDKSLKSPVILSHVRDDDQNNEIQLWYVEAVTQTIRNRFNDYCLEYDPQGHHDGWVYMARGNQNIQLVKVLHCNLSTIDNSLHACPHASSKTSQQWVTVDDVIQTLDDFELVLGVQDSEELLTSGAAPEAQASVEDLAVVKENDGSDSVRWTLNYRPAQFFYIKSKKEKEKVIDVDKEKVSAGTKAIVYQKKDEVADNQLFYEDQHGVLRCKLTDFVLDGSGKQVVFKPYDPKNNMQHWAIKAGKIVNQHDKTKVIALQQGKLPFVFHDTLQVQKSTGDEHQLWSMEYLQQHTTAQINHGGLGKYFFLKCFWEDMVLRVQQGSQAPKTTVVTSYRKQMTEDPSDQLFYVDDVTRTIREKRNDYCLEISGGLLVVDMYNPGAENQQWKVFGRKIQSRQDPTKVLTIQNEDTYENDGPAGEPAEGCYVTLETFSNALTQQFQLEHVQAQYFFVRNYKSGHVLDIYKEGKSVGAEVVQWEQKTGGNCDNQLWYEDENSVIRSKLNGYVIKATSSGSKMAQFDPVDKSQHWVVVGDRIQNKHDPSSVLDVRFHSKWKWMGIVCGTFDGGESQRWSLDYV